MKKQILSLSVAVVAAALLFACGSKGINASDATSIVSGPNSFKGTIAGTMLNDTAFNFTFDYHYTTNDRYSYSESWIEDGGTYDGKRVLWLEQYFFFDRNGLSDYGDQWSTSGKYAYLEFYMNMETLELLGTDYWSNNPTLEGMWQTIANKGNRFVYATNFYPSSNSGTFTFSGFKYDQATEILSGKVTMTLPDANTQSNWYSNYNATTMTADVKIYVPKELFQVTKKSSYYGITHRKSAK